MIPLILDFLDGLLFLQMQHPPLIGIQQHLKDPIHINKPLHHPTHIRHLSDFVHGLPQGGEVLPVGFAAHLPDQDEGEIDQVDDEVEAVVQTLEHRLGGGLGEQSGLLDGWRELRRVGLLQSVETYLLVAPGFLRGLCAPATCVAFFLGLLYGHLPLQQKRPILHAPTSVPLRIPLLVHCGSPLAGILLPLIPEQITGQAELIAVRVIVVERELEQHHNDTEQPTDIGQHNIQLQIRPGHLFGFCRLPQEYLHILARVRFVVGTRGAGTGLVDVVGFDAVGGDGEQTIVRADVGRRVEDVR